MDLNPATCWDCPIHFGEATFFAGLALFALWVGMAFWRSPRRHLRWLRIPLLGASGLAFSVLLFSVWRFTIEWPWKQPADAPPEIGFDLLFLAAVLSLAVVVIVRARRG